VETGLMKITLKVEAGLMKVTTLVEARFMKLKSAAINGRSG